MWENHHCHFLIVVCSERIFFLIVYLYMFQRTSYRIPWKRLLFFVLALGWRWGGESMKRNVEFNKCSKLFSLPLMSNWMRPCATLPPQCIQKENHRATFMHTTNEIRKYFLVTNEWKWNITRIRKFRFLLAFFKDYLERCQLWMGYATKFHF